MTAKHAQAVAALVEALFDDMDGRSGFDTGRIDKEALAEWKAAWAVKIGGAFEEMTKEETK